MTSTRSKIVFFGTPQFAVPSLRALHAAGWPITLVVTAPDKPVGRKQTLTASPVKVAALELGLPVASAIDDARADLGIIVAYNKIIPQAVLDRFPLGVINVHPSLLPKYRGPSPIQSAILNGETTTGVSIMQIDAEVDHGPVLAIQKYQIPNDKSFVEIQGDLAEMGAKLLVETLKQPLNPVPQDHAAATFTKKFTREDGRIDWTRPETEIANKVRALNPNPGTWTTWNGKTLNVLGPDTVQLDGGKPMTWAEFRRGHPGELL